MSRVAVVTGPDAGHALPALGVAAALRRRGHDVAAWTGPEHDLTARAHDVTMRPLPLLAPTGHDRDLGHRLWGRAQEMAPPLAAALGAWRPDVVVADTLTRAGAFAAQRLGVPWAEVVPHHLSDPAPDLPPVGLGRLPARTPWRRRDDRRIHRQQVRSTDTGLRQADQVARALGLPGAVPPALRLIATLPALEPPRSEWPATAHVVGPLALDPALPELEPPAVGGPLVVVTDSTATGLGRSLGAVALEGLTGLDLRLAITSSHLASRTDPTVVVGRGPHGPLLAQAALAVGFGGGGFVGKAAAAGVPLVVVPFQGDQREAAARLRASRAGRTVPAWRVGPRALRWSVVRHLADREARRAAERLAAEAAALGPDLAAVLVERLLAGELSPAGGPAEHLPGPARR